MRTRSLLLMAVAVPAFGAASPVAAQPIVLKNSHLSMTFSDQDGGVIAITNRKTGTNCIAEGVAPSFPFVVQMKETGWGPHKQTLTGGAEGLEFEHRLNRTDDGQRLDLSYDYTAQNVNLVVTVVLPDEADATSWTTSIDNQSDLEVYEMYFPSIAGVRIGGSSQDDLVVMPAGMRGGYRFANPAKGSYMAQYIGHGNMQWTDIYDDPEKRGKGGIYLGAHDRELIGCRPTYKGDGKQSVTLTMVKYAGVLPKTKWVSNPFVIAVHQGDWHRGADIYSQWAHSWLKMPRHPPWLQMCDGWDDFGRELGDNFARWHSEGKFGLRFRYPGSKQAEAEFKENLAEELARGRRISHYFNGQCFRVDQAVKGLRKMYPDLPGDLRIPAWSVLGKGAVRTSGGGYVGQYCKGPREKWHVQTPQGIPCYDYIMCPASRQWRDWLKYWIVEKYVKEYKANAIYLDQTAAAGIKNCYNHEHGHVHPGVWPYGSTSMVEEIVTEARKINPDFVMSIEGSADCLGQFANIHVISQSAVLKDPTIYPEIFFYAFPEFIIFDGYSNGRADEEGQVVFDKIFIRGHRFDLISRGAYDKAGVELRRAVKAWQYRARFRDTVGLKVSNRSVQAKLFVRNDKTSAGAVVNIWNPRGVKGATVTVSTAEFGQVRSVLAAALERDLAPWKDYRQTGQTVVLPVPAERLASYLLINRGRPNR